LEPIAGSAGGWYDTKAKQIVVDTRGPANARLRTLVHETIHALGVDCQSYPRAHAEVIVDTTTLVVLGGLGLNVSGEIIPYGCKSSRLDRRGVLCESVAMGAGDPRAKAQDLGLCPAALL
jgi:hypothetical protein